MVCIEESMSDPRRDAFCPRFCPAFDSELLREAR
jgi:hypothetical protein